MLAPWLAVGMLAGCGSQIDSIDTPDTRPVSPAPAGIYEGTMFSSKANQSVDVVGFLDGDKNRFFTFTDDGKMVVGGLYEATQPTISWTAKVFREVTTTTEDETTGEDVTTTSTAVSTLQAQGGFDPEKSVQLSYNASDGDFGTVSMTYGKTRYELPSNLASLEGNWGIEDEFGIPSASYVISQDGRISGSDVNSCNYQGSFGLIDLHYNLYRLTLAQTCGNTTVTTSGLATLNQKPGQPETILGVAVSATTSVVISLNRL